MKVIIEEYDVPTVDEYLQLAFSSVDKLIVADVVDDGNTAPFGRPFTWALLLTGGVVSVELVHAPLKQLPVEFMFRILRLWK